MAHNILTRSGRIVDEAYIETEDKYWYKYDSTMIASGVPQANDEVEIELDRRTKSIKRVWLLKQLGVNEDAYTNHNNSENLSQNNCSNGKVANQLQGATSNPIQREMFPLKSEYDIVKQRCLALSQQQIQQQSLKFKSVETKMNKPLIAVKPNYDMINPFGFDNKNAIRTPQTAKDISSNQHSHFGINLPTQSINSVPKQQFSLNAELSNQLKEFTSDSILSKPVLSKRHHANMQQHNQSNSVHQPPLEINPSISPSGFDNKNTIKTPQTAKDISSKQHSHFGINLPTQSINSVLKQQFSLNAELSNQLEEFTHDSILSKPVQSKRHHANMQQQQQQQQHRSNSVHQPPLAKPLDNILEQKRNQTSLNMVQTHTSDADNEYQNQTAAIPNPPTTNYNDKAKKSETKAGTDIRRLTYSGFVANFIKKEDSRHFGFIKCDELKTNCETEGNLDTAKKKDLYFGFETVNSNMLHLQRGDEVEFRLITPRKGSNGKSKAVNVNIKRLSKRQHIHVKDYLRNIHRIIFYPEEFSEEDMIQTKKADAINTMKLLTSPFVWKEVADQVSSFTNDDSLLILFLEVLTGMHATIKTLDEKFRQVLLNITSSIKFFSPVKGRLKTFITIIDREEELIDVVQKFLLVVIKLIPEKRPVVVSLIKPLMINPNIITAHFLYKILQNLSLGSAESISDLEWRDLPLIMKKDEIFDTELNSMSNLKPVNLTGPYESADEYFDVYFRLLREDCFNSLKKGINQLLNGKLDVRDMNVYKDVVMVGISMKNSTLYLALKITPVREVINWETSPSLMFGNLLCISVGGNFQEPIWVTVTDRDMLKKDSIVIVQTCWEWNGPKDADIILALITSKGSVWMVESPTYYRAFQPILKSLQAMDSESVSFVEELVSLEPGVMPCFLHPTFYFDASIVFKKTQFQKITLQTFFNNVHGPNSIFDKSQEEAVQNALQNRIGIIQGPPGCGKSFIGVQMLRLLLSLSSLNEPKVLILTYKNHALDEFLKGIMEHVEKSKVIRIGGRCKDPELEEISLNSHKKVKKTIDISKEIYALRDEEEIIKKNIEEKFIDLNRLRVFTYDMILEQLSHEQIKSLICYCDWQKQPLELNMGDLKDDEGFAIQKSKTKKIRVSSKVIEDILNNPDKFSQNLYKLKVETLKRWVPDQKLFDELENELIGKKAFCINIKKTNIENKNLGKPGKVKYEINDSQDIEDMQNERLVALTKADYNVKSDVKNNLKMVNYKDDNNKDYRIRSYSSKALEKLLEQNSGTVLADNDLWDMTEEDRVQFVQFIIAKSTESIRSEFQELLQKYEENCKQRLELENQHLAGILRNKQIIGVTITGAAIHQQLLKEVQPEIVIVEEAAEVLEPQLVAAIGSWTKYMLLIGDHQQLRPPVDCYELRKDFHFDVSMMERLIRNKMSFSTLKMQNRQRVELAELLEDIYPNLGTNLHRVANNEKANCISKSSFFWHHDELEKSDRSVINEEESQRAIKLALFLIQQGYQPQSITILATYQGQTTLIRKTLKDYENKYPELFAIQNKKQQVKNSKDANQNEEVIKNTVKVHTVDMYQGDENEFVIVSLVRSNKENKIGFLKEMNRRCVAQSRAKCGVYFIGNANMFANHATWRPLIEKLKIDSRVGEHMELLCKYHPSTVFRVKNSVELSLKCFCTQLCVLIMSCKRHRCIKKCQPPHGHKPCDQKIQFQHQICGHKDIKLCEEDASKKTCQTNITFTFKSCSHPCVRKCCQDPSSIICTFIVNVVLPCGHSTQKKCFENVENVKCVKLCGKIRNCNHPCEDHACYQHEAIKVCKTCEKIQKAKDEAQRKAEEKLRRQCTEDANKEIERLRKEAKNHKGAIIEPLLPEGETASEYLDIEDHVKKYVQPGHRWYPTVTKIEKVINYELLIKWYEAKKKMFKPEESSKLKFHGTSVDGVKGITQNGFRLPPTGGMYGSGIYLASDSSKSAQELYTKGSNMLLLCDSLLGKIYTVDKAMNGMTNKKIKDLGYDSLFAKRDTKATGGVLFDEFVVYNPDQVYPKYIISYNINKFKVDVITPVRFEDTFALSKKIIKSKRETNVTDPLEAHFSMVEARFLRMLQRSGNQKKCEITHIEFYMNPTLKSNFDKKHQEFKAKYRSKQESKVVFGFHGTKNNQIVDGIMNKNFIKSRAGKFGAGVYFSEQPSYTFGYGGQNHLIMAQLLPGKTSGKGGWAQNGGCEQGYDSHGAFPQPDGTFNEIVIFNLDQILPSYVIYFK